MKTLILLLIFSGNCWANADKVGLGKQLFFDKSLSKNAKQSCSTCHQPESAFGDSRSNITSSLSGAGAVSLGQDDKSLGDINVPNITYVGFVPEFHFEWNDGLFLGGLFLNGRAKTLLEQASAPIFDPLEMQNNKENLFKTMQKKYQKQLIKIYGKSVFEDENSVVKAVSDAIVNFEKSQTFASFDSKFDEFLHGKISLSEQEELGLKLFKDEEKANCAACHPVPEKSSSKAESIFTDFSYDNLGVPANSLVRRHNSKGNDFIDNGLFDNSKVKNAELKGAFRVSSLRNIAVSAPYMHNGIFNDLQTVIEFYNTRDVENGINPETKKPWRAAEVDETKNTEELGDLGLNDEEIQALIAFLKTLTDKRFEHFL